MRKLLTWLVVLAVLAGGGVGILYLTAGNGDTSALWKTEAVSRGKLLVTVSASGTIQPEDVVDVGAQVAGRIASFGKDTRGATIDYGSEVEPDMILAKIDDEMYLAAVRQAEAKVRQAESKVKQAERQWKQAQAREKQAVLRFAKSQANTRRAKADKDRAETAQQVSQRDYERVRKLRGTGSASPQEIDLAEGTFLQARESYKVAVAAFELAQSEEKEFEVAIDEAKAATLEAEAAFEDAKAALEDARAALERDRINLSYTTIRSPIKGVIIDRRVTLGQSVQASFNTPSLFLLARDLKRMKVWASVNEADWGQVRDNQEVLFTVDAYPGETFTGKVVRKRYNAQSTQNVVTYTVEVETDNSNLRLAPYQTANMQFVVARRADVTLVPNSALRYKPASEMIAPEFREEFTRNQNNKKEGPRTEKAESQGKNPGRAAVVWIADGEYLKPARIRVGLTDGKNSELLSGELKEGDVLVVGENRQKDKGGGTDNPFAPKLFQRRRR